MIFKLVFNKLNDIVFLQGDDSSSPFIKNIRKVGGTEKNFNFISQAMAPIIASHRVMAAQFGNTYQVIKCKNNYHLIFNEISEDLLLVAGNGDENDLRREAENLKTLYQHLCGHDNKYFDSILNHKWFEALLKVRGDNIAGAIGVVSDSQATVAALETLRTACDELKKYNMPHYHCLIYVDDYLLALYSSRGAEDLTTLDMLLLSKQALMAQNYWQKANENDTQIPWLNPGNCEIINLSVNNKDLIFPAAWHYFYIARLDDNSTLILVFDTGLRDYGYATFMTHYLTSSIVMNTLQNNSDCVNSNIDKLEQHIKTLTDEAKKHKLTNEYNQILSKFTDLKKSCNGLIKINPESAATNFNNYIHAFTMKVRPEMPSINLIGIRNMIQQSLNPHLDRITIKNTSGGNFDEFPGLVYFIYIDRNTGRFIAPDISDVSQLLDRNQILGMLRTAFNIVHEGSTAATWRNEALHACYTLWFESIQTSAPVRPLPFNHAQVRSLPPPGELKGSFYKQLLEICFNKNAANVCIKELLCIHIGLVPAHTAVQQARRLAHAVYETVPERPNPADLL